MDVAKLRFFCTDKLILIVFISYRGALFLAFRRNSGKDTISLDLVAEELRSYSRKLGKSKETGPIALVLSPT